MRLERPRNARRGRTRENYFAVLLSEAPPFFTCFSRHSASCFVRRAFCFLRFGESWGVVMVPPPYHAPSLIVRGLRAWSSVERQASGREARGVVGQREETDSSGLALSTTSSHCVTFPSDGPCQVIFAKRLSS